VTGNFSVVEWTALNESITVRKIDWSDPDDALIAIELLDEYSHHPMGDSGPLRPSVLSRLRNLMLNQQDACALVAFDETQTAVGLAVCLPSLSTFKAALRINIHDLFVRPDSRHQGVGQRLLQAAADEARQRGACAVTLEVRADNKAACQLYSSFGFTGIGQPTPPLVPGDDPVYFFGTLLIETS